MYKVSLSIATWAHKLCLARALSTLLDSKNHPFSHKRTLNGHPLFHRQTQSLNSLYPHFEKTTVSSESVQDTGSHWWLCLHQQIDFWSYPCQLIWILSQPFKSQKLQDRNKPQKSCSIIFATLYWSKQTQDCSWSKGQGLGKSGITRWGWGFRDGI